MSKNKKANEKNSSQADIARKLKLLTVIVAFTGAVYVCGWTAGIICSENLTEKYGLSDLPVLILLWVTAIICYASLWQFWKVCTEIGRENSFSVETHSSFRIMSSLFMTLAAIWAVCTILYLVVTQNIEYMVLYKMTELIIIWSAVTALTRALAKLIDKARQIREENDLTI